MRSTVFKPMVKLSAALLLTGASAILPEPAVIWPVTAVAQELSRPTNPDAQLLLKADEIIYDNDNEIVTARGNVQLDYDGYNVVAERVSYNQKTRRVKAFGNVEILEPNGNRIFAQEIDITDDFGVGFINALRVETPDNTRFAAESAERFADQTTVFNNGVYTACEPCNEKPDRAPLWQVKAQRVIVDGVTKSITYRNARFELFGLPIAYLPYFSHADPSVKRKTGFLIPSLGYDDKLGYSYRQPFFIKTGESHDVTVAATYYTLQGVLGEARWRHQLENGSYSVQIAGIDQQDPSQFTAGLPGDTTQRGMIGSKGEFNINPRWTFGWQVLAQTDDNFSRTYEIEGYSGSTFTNFAHLTGLHDKSYFNFAAKQYLIQGTTLGRGNTFAFESEQPTVLPVLDYNRVKSEDVFGGDLSLDVNVTRIDRGNLSGTANGSFTPRTFGIEGETTRVSADLAWKTKIITDGGLAITPSLSLRGDWIEADGTTFAGGTSLTEGSYTRYMPTAGLEVSYPILARTPGSSHIIEPIVQIFARPDLSFDGVAPNEDAQSLVFDVTNLFSRDKFSGYDRIEGGTRANIGVRYSGVFENGLSLNAMVGQSFHLAGDNPYARTDDLNNTGQESGLETDVSDIVAGISGALPSGFSFDTRARFDHSDFEIKRAEAVVGWAGDRLALSANYTFIAPQPNYAGYETDRQQVGGSASFKLNDNWSISGGLRYDLEDDLMIGNRVGISYHDECFTFSLSFAQTRSSVDPNEPNNTIGFKIGLRTIGEIDESISASDFDDDISDIGF